MDLDSIEAGQDFAEVIGQAVRSCAVLVAPIGPQWATLTDEQGQRRLDAPGDYVRFEIRTAFQRDIPLAALTTPLSALVPPKPARNDRVRADRLFDDAECMARSVTAGRPGSVAELAARERTLSGVAAALAATSP